ncbi:hypothetical protein AB0B88_16140 [Micromonospora haikouensis]|uniref:hypothetical protein n=1 Tax=Micromonospora haikouensis TaxID=686309 RepID=UPI003411A303
MSTAGETQPGLFDVDPQWQPAAPATEPPAPLSAGRRLTLRQAATLDGGRHPLTRGPLHPDAAPADDRRAPGHRCGTCQHRRPVGGTARSYPKCWHGWSGRPEDTPPRYSGGPATDVRAWWPACRDHQPADPTHHVDDFSGCE